MDISKFKEILDKIKETRNVDFTDHANKRLLERGN